MSIICALSYNIQLLPSYEGNIKENCQPEGGCPKTYNFAIFQIDKSNRQGGCNIWHFGSTHISFCMKSWMLNSKCLKRRGCHGRDHMVVGFTTTCAISAYQAVSLNLVHGKVYLIQHYVIKFVSDLRQVCGFLWFPPPIKLTATI